MTQLSNLPVDTSATDMEMADALVGAGITVVSASYSGDAVSSGVYTQGLSVDANAVPSDMGGHPVHGPRRGFHKWQSGKSEASPSTGTDVAGGIFADPDLSGLVGRNVYDAAIFEASFTSTGDTISMQLIFSSEEYLEWVNAGYNDVVGI